MSLFSMFKKNKIPVEKNILVFNIGSGSVAGGIIKFTAKPGVHTVYYHQEEIKNKPKSNMASPLLALEQALSKLTAKIQQEGLKKLNILKTKKQPLPIDSIFYLFSSPWSISQTNTIKLSEIKPFKITPEFLQQTITKHQHKLTASISKHGSIIETKVVQMKVNGYETQKIENKSTKSLELSIFSTVVPAEVIDRVNEVICKTFVCKQSHYHSLSLALFSTIRDLYPHKSDYIQINIGENITDISVIKDGVIHGEASFPMGRNYFIRELMIKLGMNEAIASSTLNMYGEGKMDPLANTISNQEIEKIMSNWMTKVSDILKNFGGKIYLPDTIFFLADTKFISFLKNKLKDEDFDILTVDKKKVNLPEHQDHLNFKIGLMFLDKMYKI